MRNMCRFSGTPLSRGVKSCTHFEFSLAGLQTLGFANPMSQVVVGPEIT
jgi:hypothetical protein